MNASQSGAAGSTNWTRTEPDRPTGRRCETTTTTKEPRNAAIRATKATRARLFETLRNTRDHQNLTSNATPCPHSDHAVQHRTALYRIPVYRQRANGAGINQVFPRGLLQPRALSAPEEPAKSRDTAGIASWRWTSATQPVRGLAICPAILGLAWFCALLGFLHVLYRRAAVANRSPDLEHPGAWSVVEPTVHLAQVAGSPPTTRHHHDLQPHLPPRTIYS